MKKADFRELVIEPLGVNDNGISEYTIEVKTADGGVGLINLDQRTSGEVDYLDISKEVDSELLDIFWDELNRRYRLMDYLESLGAIYKDDRVAY